MRRKHSFRSRKVEDLKYEDPLIGKFVNMIMERGKKTVAQKIVYGAIDLLEKKSEEESGYDVFKKGIQNVFPLLEVRSRRVGSATYQIPMEVSAQRKEALALRWIKRAAISKNGKSMAEKLAFELWDASKNQGLAVKKKEEVHKMAEANKAFAHFRF